MGLIIPEVREQVLDDYPREEFILSAFLTGFDVTWGKKETLRDLQANR